MNALQRYRFSFIAGFYAAGGSFFGKLPSVLKEGFLHKKTEALFADQALQKYSEFILCQCLPIGLMIVCNLLNWRYFLKGLQMSEQTLIATVLTAASNYVVSFILGAFVFGESFTILSLIGCTFMILGLTFLCTEENQTTEQPKFKEK